MLQDVTGQPDDQQNAQIKGQPYGQLKGLLYGQPNGQGLPEGKRSCWRRVPRGMKGCWGRKNMSSAKGHSISPLPVVHNPTTSSLLWSYFGL